MYKGIVLKTTNQYAIVMSETNEYFRIPILGSMQTGQKIYFFEEDIINSDTHQVAMNDTSSLREEGSVAEDNSSLAKVKRTLKNIWSKKYVYPVLAACLIALFVLSGLNIPLTTSNVVAVVSIDINPSIDLEINADNRVVGIRTHNEEGKSIIASADLIGLDLKDAIMIVIKKAEDRSYLKSEGDMILLAAAVNPSAEAINNDSQKIQVELDRVIDQLNTSSLPEKYNYLIVEAGSETYDKAKNNDLSVGKYEMMGLSDGQLTTENVKSMKVKDIMNQETIKQKLDDKNVKTEKNAPGIQRYQSNNNQKFDKTDTKRGILNQENRNNGDRDKNDRDSDNRDSGNRDSDNRDSEDRNNSVRNNDSSDGKQKSGAQPDYRKLFVLDSIFGSVKGKSNDRTFGDYNLNKYSNLSYFQNGDLKNTDKNNEIKNNDNSKNYDIRNNNDKANNDRINNNRINNENNSDVRNNETKNNDTKYNDRDNDDNKRDNKTKEVNKDGNTSRFNTKAQKFWDGLRFTWKKVSNRV